MIHVNGFTFEKDKKDALDYFVKRICNSMGLEEG
jgi:hypothetical protein